MREEGREVGCGAAKKKLSAAGVWPRRVGWIGELVYKRGEVAPGG